MYSNMSVINQARLPESRGKTQTADLQVIVDELVKQHQYVLPEWAKERIVDMSGGSPRSCISLFKQLITKLHYAERQAYSEVLEMRVKG